jgi:predicted naringenin-chalcone synthase
MQNSSIEWKPFNQNRLPNSWVFRPLVDLVDALRLTNVRRRLRISFTGMDVAKSFVQDKPDVVALVICVELCTLYFSFSDNRSLSIGNAIFGDGAAAVVIGAGNVGDWAIGEQRTRTLCESTRDYMTWSPNNGCYEMYLNKNVGFAFGKEIFLNLSSTVRDMFGSQADVDNAEWCVHPG